VYLGHLQKCYYPFSERLMMGRRFQVVLQPETLGRIFYNNFTGEYLSTSVPFQHHEHTSRRMFKPAGDDRIRSPDVRVVGVLQDPLAISCRPWVSVASVRE